jgi:hypothetical protein
VGFIADDKLAPQDSTIAFTSSPMIAEMVKAMGLPLTEDSALAMRNFYDGIKAFRYEGYAWKGTDNLLVSFQPIST